MKRYILTLIFVMTTAVGFSQHKHEVRAAWLTTLKSLDWPRNSGTDKQTEMKQKAELIQQLDELKRAKFNTIIFQTRMRADLAYPSYLEPFHYAIVGSPATGRPTYDPLRFVIEECHKRGMECHAWIVTLPLGDKAHIKKQGKASVLNKLKPMTISHRGAYYLNPADARTKQYLMRVVEEIVYNYDIDGIHLDYMRYPDKANMLNDSKEYKAKSRGEKHEDWRRNNITNILRHIYKGVKDIKPWVKVSVCPIGKYSDTSRYSSKGWNAYRTVSQDVELWLKEGIVDQIYPMIYFKNNDFFPFVLQWQELSRGRHIVPGLGVYFLDPREGRWQIEDIEKQINFIRRHSVSGVGYYRTEFVLNNSKGLYDKLINQYNQSETIIPAISWIDSVPPAKPSFLKAESIKEGYVKLSWGESVDNDSRNKPKYVVYASNNFPVDTSDARNIVATNVVGTDFVFSPTYIWNERKYFAVTAIDRYGNESEPTQSSL
ncbi:MAG: family 10 glycosylhydrolase [Bacteroides sp.]|nr:family 10 glycosylhydrolase [Bacteroides sp.]